MHEKHSSSDWKIQRGKMIAKYLKTLEMKSGSKWNFLWSAKKILILQYRERRIANEVKSKAFADNTTDRQTRSIFTVFENHRKSLIQHCERSELHLHFEWTQVY